MWQCESVELEDTRGFRTTIRRAGSTVGYAAFVEALRDDGSARDCLLNQLEAVPFGACYWETPPVTKAMAGRDFEYVVLAAEALEQSRPDPTAFRAHFRPHEDIACFANLSGDAVLVVPKPEPTRGAFSHLLAFLRNASQHRKHALLQHVGSAALDRISTRPMWLSTAGLGAAWLHFRLDGRPKYYK